MRKLFYAIVTVGLFTTACGTTKTITVSCPSSGARIEIDGKYAGSQQASARFNAFADVIVSAPNYITQSFRLDKDSRNVTNVCLNPQQQEEKKDDYWLASVPASDIANKTLRFRATSDKSDDEIWYTLIRYASDYFGDFTVNDKGAGWAKSTWVTKPFEHVKVRSRMELKRNPGDKKEFTLVLSSQITTNKYCNDDECYQPWDRVLKTYVELPSALSTAVQ